jgi:phospholipid-binding lipoprotein MlaA
MPASRCLFPSIPLILRLSSCLLAESLIMTISRTFRLVWILLLCVLLLHPVAAQINPLGEDPNAIIEPTSELDEAGARIEYDPWEPYNVKMFEFNRGFDRHVLKPTAKGYDFIVPNPVQKGIRNAADNLDVVRKVVNNSLQGKFIGAGKELARFVINSTVGIVGLFDVAKDGLGIEPSDQDMGITLGFYGLGPGPYLIVPMLPPLTVRDGAGFAADTLMNPLIWLTPFYVPLSITALETINNRSLSLGTIEKLEESSIDFYGAVRNAYLETRAQRVKEARAGDQ